MKDEIVQREEKRVCHLTLPLTSAPPEVTPKGHRYLHLLKQIERNLHYRRLAIDVR